MPSQAPPRAPRLAPTAPPGPDGRFWRGILWGLLLVAPFWILIGRYVQQHLLGG